MLWEEVAQYHSSAEDYMSKINTLQNFFGKDRILNQLTVEDISDFIQYKRLTCKSSSINRYLAVMSALFTRCKLKRIAIPDINLKQFKLKEPSRMPKYFKDWEVMDYIINKAPDHLKPIIRFALFTGLRKGNILGLKWENIQDGKIVIKVKSNEYEDGKWIVKKISPQIQEIFDNLPKCSNYVFTYKGQRIKDIKTAWNNIFYDKDKNLKNENIPYQCFHTLRHTHATWVYKKTKDFLLVKESLGHSDRRSTEFYTHYIDEQSDIIESVFKHGKIKENTDSILC